MGTPSSPAERFAEEPPQARVSSGEEELSHSILSQPILLGRAFSENLEDPTECGAEFLWLGRSQPAQWHLSRDASAYRRTKSKMQLIPLD